MVLEAEYKEALVEVESWTAALFVLIIIFTGCLSAFIAYYLFWVLVPSFISLLLICFAAYRVNYYKKLIKQYRDIYRFELIEKEYKRFISEI